MRSRTILLAAAAVLVLLGVAGPGGASVWNTDASANWSVAGDWTGGIPNAADAIADFSTLNITATRTVTIDTTSRTVGSMIFADTTPTSSGWIIAGSGGGQLTLDVTAGSPTVTVNNLGTGTASITATVNGNDG